MIGEPEPVICGRTRVNVTDNKIAGLGEQVVPYSCPNIAALVHEVDGEPACLECAEALRDQADAAKLSRLAKDIMAMAAGMSYRAQLYDWLVAYASEIDRVADELEGNDHES
jgi:hypothetical protein